MAIPESADIIQTAAEAEQRVKEERQQQHEQLVAGLNDPADAEGQRRRAEQQVETTLGQMPVWVHGAMDVPKGESTTETKEDVPDEPKQIPAKERQ